MSMHFQSSFQDAQFDIFDWYPSFQSCARYFVEHAQYSVPVQTVAACINILLPYQRGIQSSSSSNSAGPSSSSSRTVPGTLPMNLAISVSLVPYIRRLVVTGFDSQPVLHGFFGDDWKQGIGALHESERRNYLFAAKSDNWLKVKSQYDMGDGQSVPFLRPLQNVTEEEIQSAETNWSEWLAMQDWMLGPRAPPDVGDGRVRVKQEQE